MQPHTATISHRKRVHGCLLAGALGDALGAPVEFLTLAQIRRCYGRHGITDLAPAYGRLGAITDDTQMTLFTAEGLLRARSRPVKPTGTTPATAVFNAYIRWLYTQGERSAYSAPVDHLDGWLSHIGELYECRAPGATCLKALRDGVAGTTEQRINDSKGCGGVMRVAPAGLVDDPDPFQLGSDLAALTHGHPSGFLSAGALALIIDRIVHGVPMADAARVAIDHLRAEPEGEECADALELALDLSRTAPPSAETIERLGQGWVGEEALAIGVYAALAAGDDLPRGLRLAVNHGGDSDSTGAIAGNLLGASLGVCAIPLAWLEALELRDEIRSLAHDLIVGFEEGHEWSRRYPGW